MRPRPAAQSCARPGPCREPQGVHGGLGEGPRPLSSACIWPHSPPLLSGAKPAPQLLAAALPLANRPRKEGLRAAAGAFP